jgi:acyl-[acyl-carrier-protein]-phospholipid O-acyltransferase/long-chain-fatty-acid--[acyl-carrier-protein] ligase
VFLHPSPLHYRSVPDTIYDTNSTVVISTNTFLTGYARRAHPYDFRSVRMLIAAAEKVHPHTFQEWSEKFGIRILEGYGATECGPALSTNVPLASRVGSAGRFLPGIEWRLDPVEGMRDGGRLLVRGPNVMRGYLQVEPHQKIVNGWYDTGDVVRVDADGYVFLIGRLKRFAKIGGEMISLVAVEDAIVEGLRESGLENATAVLRRALPSKGECLVAVTCSTQVTRERIRHILGSRGFSPVCVPGEVRFMARMPRLGTGKIDLQHLQRLLDQNQIPLLSETIPCPPDTVFPKP